MPVPTTFLASHPINSFASIDPAHRPNLTVRHSAMCLYVQLLYLNRLSLLVPVLILSDNCPPPNSELNIAPSDTIQTIDPPKIGPITYEIFSNGIMSNTDGRFTVTKQAFTL
ncbi:hypothetical protein A2U01_0009687 [Trifolium medium]|uniref:Uncharacterized protein n=1 Tax=Trifolium medium TaxID=97028 RepID=A0A392MR02_9FABA|nr:hypothetical protein [Trifolium medium]MCH88704.1 hypothetical protein [Trifolium medium]MCH88794.1 hypothetical protein [Trifolium medium]